MTPNDEVVNACCIIISVSNRKCISNQRMKINVWCSIHSKIISEFVS